MNLFQQPGSPFWFVTFTDPDTGKRVRRSTKVTGKHAAKRAAEEIVRKYGLSKAASARTENTLTLRGALERYAEYLRREERPSLRWVESMLTRLVDTEDQTRFTFSPDKPVSSLTPLDMDSLVSARLAEGKAPQTVAHEVKALRAAVNHAADLGFAFPKAMEGRSGRASPWRLPRVTRKTRYLSRDEWRAVYDALSPDRPVVAKTRTARTHEFPLLPEWKRSRQDIQDLFVLLTLTGGRWSEVVKLTWDRVDTEGFAWVRLWGSKTQRERVAGVPEMASKVLRRRFEARTGVAVFPGKDGLAFRTASSATPISKAMDACGLNRSDIVAAHGRATVHSLRHTYASWLLQNGADLAEVQEALGHKSLDMTRRYAHLGRKRSMDRIRSILDDVGGDEDDESLIGMGEAA